MHNILIFVAAMLALPISALPARQPQVGETVKNSPSDLLRKDLIGNVDVLSEGVDALVFVPVDADLVGNAVNVLAIGDSITGDSSSV
jgi:hypothetical protein